MLQTRSTSVESARRPTVSLPTLADPIAQLMAQVGAACDGPPAVMGERVVKALRAATAVPGLLSAEFRVSLSGCYARHTIASDPAGRFTLLSLVWGPGQFSPPHAHDTWCAYAVADNPLTETLYEFDARRGLAVAFETAVRASGYACFAPAGLEQIHRLGNAGDVPAISIHIYGIDGARVGTHVNRLIDVAERKG